MGRNERRIVTAIILLFVSMVSGMTSAELSGFQQFWFICMSLLSGLGGWVLLAIWIDRVVVSKGDGDGE